MADDSGKPGAANPVQGVSLTTSTTAATSGVGAVEVYRWLLSPPLHFPPPDQVLMIAAVATVPFIHAIGKGIMAWINRRMPEASPVETQPQGAKP